MKKIIILITLFMTSLILISCDDYIEESDNGEIYTEKEWDVYDEGHQITSPIEIDFWSANSAVDIHGVALANMIDEFNQYQKETYPDSWIKVNASFQGGYVNQNSKLQSALISNTNPEIAMVGVSSFALYYENVVDMRQVFTYDDIRDIYEGFLQFAMYRHVFVGYPFFAASNVILLNRTMAEATDLDVPTVEEIIADPENSNWTWEHMRNLAQAMRHSSGEQQIYGLASSGPALYEMMYTQGVPVYNENATQQLFNNEYGRKGLEYWQNLVKDDIMKNPVLDPNHGTRIQGEFTSGHAGMLFSSSSAIGTLFDIISKNGPDGGPGFEVDVLPHPKVTNFYSNQSGGGIVIFNNKSKARTTAAVEFLRWLQAPEQSARYSIETGYLTTTRSSTQTDAWLAHKEINPLLDRVIQLMVFVPPAGIKVPIGRAKALADTDFGNYVKGIFYENATRNLDDVLKETAERVQYILDTNN